MFGEIPGELIEGLFDPADPAAVLEVWLSVPCPRCGAAVQFRPRQKRNRCGWCRTKVKLAATAT